MAAYQLLTGINDKHFVGRSIDDANDVSFPEAIERAEAFIRDDCAHEEEQELPPKPPRREEVLEEPSEEAKSQSKSKIFAAIVTSLQDRGSCCRFGVLLALALVFFLAIFISSRRKAVAPIAVEEEFFRVPTRIAGTFV